MTPVPTLYTKHLGLANTIAKDYYILGAGRDDVHQEAHIGLWIAARSFDQSKGIRFSAFAGTVIRRRLATIVKGALREKHLVLTNADREDVELAPGMDIERVVIARDTLARMAAATASLTELEREALRRLVNGEPYVGNKALDNATQRVRRKFKEAT